MLSSPAVRSALSQLPHELAHALAASYRLNPQYNAFTNLLSPQDALQDYSGSARTDSMWDGVPVAVKDVFCTTRLPTTAASAMLDKYQSPFEATVVSRLRAAGAIVTGKTNMDEFGMGSANLHSHFGPSVNPLYPDAPPRVAGGSSGGSAVAVALGLCRVALASDTGGSTRLPAAYCGVIGFKPSYGLLSRWGMLAYASSLDTVGIMAKEMSDIRAVFGLLCKYDEKDPTSVTQHYRDVAARMDEHWQAPASMTDLSGLRIGVPAECFLSEVSPSVLPSFRRAVDLLRSMGAKLISVSLPSIPRSLSAYYVLACAEASSNLAKYDGVRYGFRAESDLPQAGEDERLRPLYSETRSRGFGDEVQKRLLLGAYALSADAFDNYYLNAQRVRKSLRLEFASVFRTPSALDATPRPNQPEGVDVLLHPSATSSAPLLSSALLSSTESYTQDILNVPASLAGLPALSVPTGLANDGWPVGTQIVGQWGQDDMVLGVAEALQEAGRDVFEVAPIAE